MYIYVYIYIYIYCCYIYNYITYLYYISRIYKKCCQYQLLNYRRSIFTE